jgi:hypothetical protein
VREYELYVPLFYNDGGTIEPTKHRRLKSALMQQFGGLTFSTHPYEGAWIMGGVAYRDSILIYRILAPNARTARSFFRELKEQLKQDLQQEEILIVERRAKRI